MDTALVSAVKQNRLETFEVIIVSELSLESRCLNDCLEQLF